MSFNKINIIKAVQTKLGLVSDGNDGPITWNAIASKLDIVPVILPTNNTLQSISDAAYKLILDYEVGGGESYYNSALKHPTYPGGASGVTIGIGYDLGYTTSEQFISAWGLLLSKDVFNCLGEHLGKKGDAAKAVIHSLNDIVIPWSVAEVVFKSRDIPRYIKETITAFPGADKLKPDAFGTLVSLVFNRGGSTAGATRKEMLNIKLALAGTIKTDNIYIYISDQILAMKRLWIGKGLDGLLSRRNEEASLVHSCA